MSKIPEGATHTFGDRTYRKKIDGVWFAYADGCWWIAAGADSKNYRPIQADPEWSGEGLPPVGTVCELWVRDYLWERCQVIAMDEQDGRPVSVVRWGGGYYSGTNKCLRPIRTSEQVAAERARSAVCDRIYGIITGPGVERKGNTSDMAEALYDEGLRFVEVVK